MKRLKEYSNTELLLGRPITKEFALEMIAAFNRAIDRLQSAKWIQGAFFEWPSSGPPCGYCLHGSLYKEYYNEVLEFNAYPPALWCRRLLSSKSFTPEWNDKAGRTKEEVIDALKQQVVSLNAELD